MLFSSTFTLRPNYICICLLRFLGKSRLHCVRWVNKLLCAMEEECAAMFENMNISLVPMSRLRLRLSPSSDFICSNDDNERRRRLCLSVPLSWKRNRLNKYILFENWVRMKFNDFSSFLLSRRMENGMLKIDTTQRSRRPKEKISLQPCVTCPQIEVRPTESKSNNQLTHIYIQSPSASPTQNPVNFLILVLVFPSAELDDFWILNAPRNYFFCAPHWVSGFVGATTTANWHIHWTPRNFLYFVTAQRPGASQNKSNFNFTFVRSFVSIPFAICIILCLHSTFVQRKVYSSISFRFVSFDESKGPVAAYTDTEYTQNMSGDA